jgi:hypothetical protein
MQICTGKEVGSFWIIWVSGGVWNHKENAASDGMVIDGVGECR